VTKNKLLALIPWADVWGTLDELVEAGTDRDEALDLVAKALDQALPLDQLIPTPVGAALESVDGPVLRALLGLGWSLATDAKARAARKAKRAAKKAA
jgi:hypothetical protein